MIKTKSKAHKFKVFYTQCIKTFKHTIRLESFIAAAIRDLDHSILNISTVFSTDSTSSKLSTHRSSSYLVWMECRSNMTI